MKKIIRFFIPPANWQLTAIIIMGAGIGLIAYLFKASNAVSYLSDDPETCINCHVMRPQYATWNHSSHRKVATCNDCHVPHDNMIRKYTFKAKDGMRHATVFTMRNEPQVIQIREEGLKVVQENCVRCHENLNHTVGLHELSGDDYLQGKDKVCWSCHREVPHGRVNSLSSTPDAFAPFTGSIVPEWMKTEKDNTKQDK